jgi:hypothetical protein|tara:strand:- start:80 stop:493 length:414 start_codon:yes stop_codon:yes gene_type:complete
MTKREKMNKTLRYEFIILLIKTNKASNNKYYKFFRRAIQVAAWDGANTLAFFTGMITENAKLLLSGGLKKTKLCKEHWYGATQLADDLMEMDNLNVEIVKNYIYDKLSWNYTTSEENVILKHNNQDYSSISNLVLFN